MQSSNATDHAPGLTRASVRATTRKLSAKVLTYFSQRENEQLRLLRQGLMSLAGASKYTEQQIHHFHRVRTYFDHDATAFNSAFIAALEKCLSDEIKVVQRASERHSQHDSENADFMEGLTLSLVGSEEMDRMLARDEAAQRFNVHYEDALTSLTLRLRSLFGSEVASLVHNPYRPEILVRALLLALKNSGFEEDVAQSALLAFEPQHSLELRPLYAELEAILEQSGITAQTMRLRKAHGTGATRSASFEELAPGTGSAGFLPSRSMPGYAPPVWRGGASAREFLSKLGLGATGTVPRAALAPSVGGGFLRDDGAGGGLSAAAIEPYLVAYLEELQACAIESFAYHGLDLDLGSANVLHDLSGHEEIRSAPEFDRGTVDALAAVFDYVFSDPDIAPALKVIIGRLQIPVLKAALLDRNFFSSSNHPARKLIDALAGAAVVWAPDQGTQDPLYLKIEACVKRLLAEFDHDLALFAEVLLDFEDFLALSEQQARQQVQALASDQETQEALEAARAHADDALHERLVNLPEDGCAFLLPFLTNQWREVLARAYTQLNSQPERWPKLLLTTDQLLWSTQRKRDSAQRRELVTVLPELVRQLNASLDELDWNPREREKFTRRLIAAHMNAIRSTPDETPAPTEALDLQAGAEAVGKLRERRAAARVLQPESFDTLALGFERGVWFDFLNADGLSLRCRLTWVSPKRTRFLFTNREGFDAFVRSQAEVVDLMRRGQLKVLPQEPIVARAIDQILVTSTSVIA